MTFQPLEQFFDRSLIGTWFPSVRYQSTNPSPCTFGPIDSECMVKWRPVPREVDASQVTQSVLQDLNHPEMNSLLEDGLDSLVEVVQFMVSYWSGPIDCRFGYSRLILDCGVWNEADLRRKMTTLRHSVSGSVLNGEPTTIPIAWSADDSGHFVGLHTETGAVYGSTFDADDEPGEYLAASLSDFLCGLRGVDGYFRDAVQTF